MTGGSSEDITFTLCNLPKICPNTYPMKDEWWNCFKKCVWKARKRSRHMGEIETYYPGFLVVQDTYYVGHIKGVGHILSADGHRLLLHNRICQTV